MVGTAGGCGILNIGGKRSHHIPGENILLQKIVQESCKFLFPFPAMGRDPAPGSRFRQQVSDFVNVGYEKGIRVQIVVDCNLMGEAAPRWTIVAQFAGARTRNLQVNVVLDDPSRACVHCFRGKVLR